MTLQTALSLKHLTVDFDWMEVLSMQMASVLDGQLLASFACAKADGR